MSSTQPVTFTIVGAGARGLFRYAPFALKFPEKARIVAVAEPRQWFRQQAADLHHLPGEMLFSDWRQLLDKPRLSDAVIISTQDRDHLEPALALMEKGYDVLLEKPMAQTEQDCRTIVAAARKSGVVFAVCHVLRYSPYFQKIREIVQSGVLGQISNVRHIEQVGFWHYAHSYVRGNWRNEALSSPILLAKSCHDMDILLFMLGKKCRRVSSFGSRSHFRKEQMPAQAAARCVDCVLADGECPYSAKKFYLSRVERGETGWPLDVITQDFSEQGVLSALRQGPYGKCVYQNDNDVLDHQVVALEFDQGISATFTLNAFTADDMRQTDIFGSHGELRGNGRTITIRNFARESEEQVAFSEFAADDIHLGGDERIMEDFVAAVKAQDQDLLVSSPAMSLESHLMVFAAERARLTGTVQDVVPDLEP